MNLGFVDGALPGKKSWGEIPHVAIYLSLPQRVGNFHVHLITFLARIVVSFRFP